MGGEVRVGSIEPLSLGFGLEFGKVSVGWVRCAMRGFRHIDSHSAGSKTPAHHCREPDPRISHRVDSHSLFLASLLRQTPVSSRPAGGSLPFSRASCFGD